MKAHKILLSCPQCGEEFSLLWREYKHNRNLKLTCAKCGLVHLAQNAIQIAIYNRAKKAGYPISDPPVPEPLDPVRIFPGKDGTEIVIKRHKTTGDVIYTRRAKVSKKPRTQT